MQCRWVDRMNEDWTREGYIMQREKHQRRYCKVCQEQTKFTQHTTAMGCGDLFMVVCTFGIWLILRVLFTPPFRCNDCGSN